MLAALAAVVASGPPAARADEAAVAVTKQTACVPVEAGGATQPLYVERFTAGTPAGDAPVLLMVHGVDSSTRTFDLTEAGSVARALARRGYVVVTYDRLGYAASPYLGAGGDAGLSGDLQQLALHQLVGAVRDGSFRTGSATDCRGGATSAPARTTPPASRIVLVGHSFGAFLIAGYPGRFPGDVDGLVLADSESGVQAFRADGSLADQPPPADPLADGGIAYHFVDGRDPGFTSRAECERVNVEPSGADPSLVDALCGHVEDDAGTPQGDPYSIGPVAQANARSIARMQGAKVLLIAGDRDRAAIPPADFGREQEAYLDRCGCDVRAAVMPDTAHMPFVHRSLPLWIATVDGWLRSRGLGATPPPVPIPTPVPVAAVAPGASAARPSLGPLRLASVVDLPPSGCVRGGTLRVRARRDAVATLQRVTVLVGGRRLSARASTLAVPLPGPRVVRIGVVTRDGRAAHVARRYRPCG